MQVWPLRDVAALLDSAGQDVHTRIGDLEWPSDAYATDNFVRAASLETADFVRRPGFVLVCRDGSLLCLSEREAHCILDASWDVRRNAAAQAVSTSLVHLAFAAPVLPAPCDAPGADALLLSGRRLSGLPAGATPDRAARHLVAAQLLAGHSSYKRLPGSSTVQDEARVRLLARVVGGDGSVAGVRGATAAVRRLLDSRRRGKHFVESDLDDVCCDAAARARAAALSGGDA